MSEPKVTAFESTKNHFLNNYGKCFTLAVSPLAISYLLGFQSGHTVPIGRGSKKMGLASLVITVPLTLVTSGVATVGAVANTVYGAVALPVSAIKDKVSPKAEPLPALNMEDIEDSEDIFSSTEQMLASMPKQEKEVTETLVTNNNPVTKSADVDDQLNGFDEIDLGQSHQKSYG